MMGDRLRKLFEEIQDEAVSKEKAKHLLQVHKRIKNNLYSSQKVFDIVSHKIIEDIMEGREN